MVLARSLIQRFPYALNIFGQPMTIFGIPVDRETIFIDRKGRYQAGIEKRQRHLIAKTTFINFFLESGERIRCLTTGFSPVDTLEQFLTGPAFLFFKRAYFIFTDKRILHIPARIDHSSPSAISQIVYEDCARITLKGRSLIVDYKNDHQEIFPYIHRKERRRLKTLLQAIVLKPKESGRLHGRTYLCPGCARILDKTRICTVCKLKFKTNRQATIRALLIPGGGYFYSRYPVLGFVIGILETGLMASLAFQWSNFQSDLPVDLRLMALLSTGLIIEKFIMAYHSTRLTQDFIPEEKEFTMRRIHS